MGMTWRGGEGKGEVMEVTREGSDLLRKRRKEGGGRRQRKDSDGRRQRKEGTVRRWRKEGFGLTYPAVLFSSLLSCAPEGVVT